MNRLALMFLKNIHIVPAGLAKLWHYAANVDKYPEQETWDHIQNLMSRAITAGNVDLQVTGLENIPTEGGCMLYGNHQGLFDVVAISGTCTIPLGAVFKKELSEIPMVKQICQCTRSFAMDREDVRQSLTVIQNVTKEVQSGRKYLIFPEGTRSRNGNVMGEFHGGSFRCALKAKCPIVPIALVDSFKVLDQKGSKPLTVQLHYLEPIPYEQFQHMKTGEIAELVKNRIQEVLDREAN